MRQILSPHLCSGYDYYYMLHVLCDKGWWQPAGLWSVQGQTERKSKEGCIFNPRILSWKAKLLQRALRFLHNSTAPQPRLMGEERNCMSTDKDRLVLEINYCENNFIVIFEALNDIRSCFISLYWLNIAVALGLLKK